MRIESQTRLPGISLHRSSRGKPLHYEALIHFDTDSGFYIAEVPDLPGCGTYGPTKEEVEHQLPDAIALYLLELRAIGQPIPNPTTHSIETVRVPE